MALSYPLSMPSQAGARMRWRLPATVGASVSPFTGAQQTYDWVNGKLAFELELPRLTRAAAAEFIGLMVAMRGRAGSVLAGPLGSETVRGTWAGSPKVKNAHNARVTSIGMDGFSVGATIKRMDWFQQGTGSSSRLHMVVADATANGSGELTIECWPPTRAALADNDTFVTSSPKGLFMLTSQAEWSIERAQMYGLQLSFEEDLRGL